MCRTRWCTQNQKLPSQMQTVWRTSSEPDKSDKTLEPEQHMLNSADPNQEEIKLLQTERPENTTKESPGPKSSTKKSSRIFTASYFSSANGLFQPLP